MSSTHKKSKSQGRGQKLLYFLAQLSAPEALEFVEYLESPLLGNSPQLAEWTRRILAQSPEAQAQGLFPEDFSNSTPPNTSYVWVRFSQLQQHILDFVAFRAFRNQPLLQEKLLLREMNRRRASRFFPWLYQRAHRNTQKVAGSERLLAQLQLNLVHSDYMAGAGQTELGTESGLRDTALALDSYYVVQKLKITCAEFSHRIFAGPTLELRQVEEVFQLALQPPLWTLPLVRAYFYACRLLQRTLAHAPDAEQDFSELKKHLHQPADLAPTDARDLFAIAQNYAIWRFHQGSTGYLQELTDLYEEMLRSGVALDQGTVDPAFYKNTVMLMCQMGNVDWAAGFVEDYRDRVANDPGQLLYLYNSAVVAFFQGQFSQVVELLYQEIPRFQQASLVIGARVYFCRALWMQEEYEWLLNALKGFGQYLSRAREVVPEDKSRYRGYIRLFQKMALAATASTQNRKKKVEQLSREMESAGKTATYRWLWHRLQEMK